MLGVQPAFEAFWGGPDRLYNRRLGARWQHTNPFNSLLDSGVTLAGGSDSPITPIDPLAGIRAAIDHPNAGQRVTAGQALAMFTSAAAYSLGLEGRAGCLRPGMDADFTVLSADPRTSSGCEVIATLRAGKSIYENKKLSERPLSS